MSYWTNQMERPLRELSSYKKAGSLELCTLLRRFVVETEKRDEFLAWAAKDMDLHEPMDLTRVDALIAAYARAH